MFCLYHCSICLDAQITYPVNWNSGVHILKPKLNLYVRSLFKILQQSQSTPNIIMSQWQNTRAICVLVSIRRTELRDIPVIFWISLGLLLDPGLSSWLHISSATRLTFCAVLTVLGRPLPAFRQIEFVASILRKRSLTELTDHFLLGNSLQIRFAPHPFFWRRSLIDDYRRLWDAYCLSTNCQWPNSDVALRFR